MKKLLLIFTLLSLSIALCDSLYSQEVEYKDAALFPVYGKVSDATNNRYERLPSALQAISRGPVWFLGRNSAGLFIRFRSNSTSIHVKWESAFDTRMTHMTDTGAKGLDLYAIHEGEWTHVCSAQPQGKTSQRTIISNMDPIEREYMLYLSLYDGVSSLEIGVDKGAMLDLPAVDRPSREKPIVMYGTSILQGGCANRPGMAHTNIISRRLDREVINLGFSGNALLDMEIAELMASVPDPGLFVMDYAPNAYAHLIDENQRETIEYLSYLYSPRFLADIAKKHNKVFDDLYGLFTSAECEDFIQTIKQAGEEQLQAYEQIKNASTRVRRAVLGEIKEKAEGGLYYTKPFRELMNCILDIQDFLCGTLTSENAKQPAYFYRQMMSFYKSASYASRNAERIAAQALQALTELEDALKKEIVDLARFKQRIGDTDV